MSDQFQNQLDVDLLRADLNDDWVPFSVRYGFRKLSDYLKPNPNYPKPEGFLWAPPRKGTPPMSELDDAAARVNRISAQQTDHATASLGRGIEPSQFWIDETQWKGELDMPDTETDPHMFITQEGITKSDLGEAMREYRSLDVPWPGSPWAADEIGVLSSDFINWYRWERL